MRTALVRCLASAGRLARRGQFEVAFTPRSHGATHEHGYDHDNECGECQNLDRTTRVFVDRDATWEWWVEVETWGPKDRGDGAATVELLETDRWTIGYTDIDPREVEYGPHWKSPERAALLACRSRDE